MQQHTHWMAAALGTKQIVKAEGKKLLGNHILVWKKAVVLWFFNEILIF